MIKLKIEYLPISDLFEYRGNAKLHPKRQVEQIAESIRQFGFNDPIAIDETGMIIEGHGRLLAAYMLGMDKVPVIRLKGLSDEQKRAYTLVHNQLTMNTGFDIDQLTVELSGISEFEMAAFDFEVLEPFDMNDIQAVNSYDEDADDREYFSTAFMFPAKSKKAIMKYLRKHKKEIVENIIMEAINGMS